MDTADCVSLVDEVLVQRRWWAEQWPEGTAYVEGLVAQDVQEALADQVGRWPLCRETHDDGEAEAHELRVSPDLGEDPHWVCEEAGVVIAPVGHLLPQA